MADIEKIKSMGHAKRAALYVKYDRLFDKIEMLFIASSGEAHRAYSKVLDIISDMAVDVEVKRHGKWIEYETTSYKNSEKGIAKKYYRCSICRNASAIRRDFCPECGAKMDGKDGEENG